MKIPLLIQSIQIAYFLGSIDLSDRLKVANEIKTGMGDVLNGIPTILPIPDDAPFEIPRVILTSKDRNKVCNVASNRLDFIHKTPSGQDGIEIQSCQEELPKNIAKLNKVLFETLKASSHRLGLIINYTAIPKQGGLEFIKTKFLGDPKDNSTELQIHKLTKGEISSMKINNWVRFMAKSQQPKHLSIISDLNTLQQEKYEISEGIALAYFDNAFKLSLKTFEDIFIEGN